MIYKITPEQYAQYEEGYQKTKKDLLAWVTTRGPKGPGRAQWIRFLRGKTQTQRQAIVASGYECSGENDAVCTSVCPMHMICPYHFHHSRHAPARTKRTKIAFKRRG